MLLPSATQGSVNFTGFRDWAKTRRGRGKTAAVIAALRNKWRRVVG
jgi:hypothetical protein